MSRFRYVKGSITKISGGNHNIYSRNGNINFIAAKKVNSEGVELGELYTNNPAFPESREINISGNYIVHFRRPPDYDCEFGFDWMRTDYLPSSQGGKDICVEGLEELKKIYTPFTMTTKHINTEKPYGDYYVPWLSMFPHHKAKIGKDIRLFLESDLDYDNSIDPYSEQLTIESESSAIKISPNSLTLFDTWNGGKEIIITSDAPLTADTTINVKSSEGKIVGKLNVVKNSDQEKYTINVYVVKSYITDDSSFEKNIIDGEINKIGDHPHFWNIIVIQYRQKILHNLKVLIPFQGLLVFLF